MSCTATPRPTSRDLKNGLFEDEWERRWFVDERFVDERIVYNDHEHDMPEEQEEARPELGVILVRCEEDEFVFDPFADRRIISEVAFIDAKELENKREAAYAWVMETAARDISPLVITYTLTHDETDFETLATLPLPWQPGEVKVGSRFFYHGIAYPLLEARGIMLPAHGEFEIRNVGEDDSGQPWFEVQNLEDNEHLYLTGTLLTTAIFPVA